MSTAVLLDAAEASRPLASSYVDWESLGKVASVSFLFAGLIVVLFSVGVALLSRDSETADGTLRPRRTPASVVAMVCFGICGLAVLFGIWLIVPVFH